MNKRISLLLAAITAVSASHYSQAATFTIGDNDGYGIGIADGATAPFTLKPTPYDGRSDAEKAASDGAQFTDTYSTTHPDFSPQDGTVATFTFSKLGSGLKSGSLKVDMAEFEAKTYGAVLVNFNGIAQDWAFEDGFTNTVVRDFDLSQAVIDSINSFGELVVTVDRNKSRDFYGFDFLQLSVENGNQVVVPIPAAIWLFSSAVIGLLGFNRRK